MWFILRTFGVIHHTCAITCKTGGYQHKLCRGIVPDPFSGKHLVKQAWGCIANVTLTESNTIKSLIIFMQCFGAPSWCSHCVPDWFWSRLKPVWCAHNRTKFVYISPNFITRDYLEGQRNKILCNCWWCELLMDVFKPTLAKWFRLTNWA